MRNMVVHDLRLDKGNTPSGNFSVLQVNGSTPLSEFVVRTLTVANLYGEIYKLTLMAHGYQLNGSHGYGVQLCREDLKLSTVWRLAPLKGSVYMIYLMACGAAHYTPGTDGRDGDGWTFCKRLAWTTGAWVKASTAVQDYDYFNPNPWHWMEIDYGDWEGDVFWFAP